MVSNAVANWEPTTEDLAAIDSFEDAAKLFAANGLEAVDATKELGDGFPFIEAKEELEGVPFLILKFDFGHDQYDRKYSNVWGITTDNRKFKLYDSSTGIMKQLEQWADRNPDKPWANIAVKHGLNRSDYTYTDKKTGEKSPATTFYLAVS